MTRKAIAIPQKLILPKAIALGVPAMTILKFNQQDNSDYIEPSHNEIYN